MRYPLVLALSLAPLALAPLACGGADPAATAPIAPPVVVDLSPPPAASVAAKPAGPRPEPAAEGKPADALASKLREVAEFGRIGVLGAGDGGAPLSPDELVQAKGNMWGDSIGDAFGAGGLGLAGVGASGGRTQGIGLGSIGTLGHGSGLGGPVPKLRAGATTVNGRLPPEVIQRIVRQSFGRFRLCYESGLKAKATLAGKVTIKFVIETDGSVSSVASDAGGTTMPDKNVVACVVRAFNGLGFPAPEAGKVSVVYPLTFSPPDDPPPAKPDPQLARPPPAALPPAAPPPKP